MWGSKKSLPLSSAEIEQLQQQIANAEKLSSAEFKIILARSGWLGLRQKARQLFRKYGMDKTVRHNAVLILVDYSNRNLVVLGDSPIDSKIGSEFRTELENMLSDALKGESLFAALVSCIGILGSILPIYFPADPESNNELSNELVFEDC